MVISRAPLRMSFFGGGTDFPEYFNHHGGAVLATAIDKFSYVTASKFQSYLFDYKMRVSYSRGELAKEIDDIQHPVFRECLRYCGLEKDIELHTVADLPAFTGLGSSSTFTVSLLQALHAYQGRFVSPKDIGYQAIHIERNVLKECVGVQDQMTAAVGGFNILEFHDDDDIRVIPVLLSRERLLEIQAHLFLVFTGIKRRSQDMEVNKIRNLNFNLAHLREMRHMVTEGYDILTSSRSMEEFGKLLHKGWDAKQQLSKEVTTSEINELYYQGLAAGAWGGKLLGAGGGGFLLLCAPPEKQAAIAACFPTQHLLPVTISAPGVQIIYAS